MNRPIRPLPLTWSVRLRTGESRLAPLRGRADPSSESRPGIAARWKPRDRVSAAGN